MSGDHVNKPLWLSIASFLSLQFLQQEMKRRREAERGARGPACGDTRPLCAAEPVCNPDGNHGEIVK